jgi:hypothetical protein
LFGNRAGIASGLDRIPVPERSERLITRFYVAVRWAHGVFGASLGESPIEFRSEQICGNCNLKTVAEVQQILLLLLFHDALSAVFRKCPMAVHSVRAYGGRSSQTVIPMLHRKN